MPANDFAPDNPAAVDEGKIYLIRGATLKKLLAQDSFDNRHFEVKPEGLARKITLKPQPVAAAGDVGGGDLIISHTFVAYDPVNNDFYPTGDPTFFYWKNGRFVGVTNPFVDGDTPAQLDIASPEQG